MKRVTEILVFPNGNIAAFDDVGQQIPELQRKSVGMLIAAEAVRLGYDYAGCKMKMGRGEVEMFEYNGYREVFKDSL